MTSNLFTNSARRLGWLMLGFALAGCDRLPKHLDLVTLVDVSATVHAKDSSIYLASFHAALRDMHRGDNLVIGRISEQTLGTFNPYAEYSFPDTHNENDDDSLATIVVGAAEDTLRTLLRKRTARETNILDAVSAAAELFARHGIRRSNRVLLLLTDGLEEDRKLNFRLDLVDSAYTDRVIAARRAASSLPNLTGIRVLLAGAGAADGETYVRTRRFWTKYFQATGATIDSAFYGRAALANVR